MKHKLAAFAIVIVATASVAYAAFAQNFTVNGTGTAAGNWAVQITNISLVTAVGATNKTAPTVAADGLSATFSADLAYPGATGSYDVTIKNNGTIPAKLSTISDLTATNAAAQTYITYVLSGVAVNDTLAAGATATARVTVSWASSATTNPSGANKSATITFGYVQNI